jgi:HlyD family secretion protein
MPEENPIFRKVALDRLSSPEQLDRLMQVTSPKGWIALWALGGVLVLALIWGIFGIIPTKVNGQGILIKGGTVFDLVTAGSGVITKIYVNAGTGIQTNDLIALIGQPELQLRIHNTRNLLTELKLQDEELGQSEVRTLRIDLSSLSQERTNLWTSITNYQAQIVALGKKLTNQTTALKNGLIIESALLATQNEIFAAQQEEARARQRLLQIGANENDRPMQLQQLRAVRHQKIEETAGDLDLLEKQLELTSQVKSPYEGTVLELVVDPGTFVQAGARILSLETKEQLKAVMFTPPDQGKRVKPEMEVQISPATIKKEEAGFIRGTVSFVSAFPSTPERMMRVLRNQDLVRQLSGAGAPIEVLVILKTNNAGSYVWSSSNTNKPPEISSGTLCNGSIVVKRSRPIALVLPLLKETIGM